MITKEPHQAALWGLLAFLVAADLLHYTRILPLNLAAFLALHAAVSLLALLTAIHHLSSGNRTRRGTRAAAAQWRRRHSPSTTGTPPDTSRRTRKRPPAPGA